MRRIGEWPSSLSVQVQPDPCWTEVEYLFVLQHVASCKSYMFAGEVAGCTRQPIVRPLAEGTVPTDFPFADLPQGDYKVSVLATHATSTMGVLLSRETYRRGFTCNA